MSDQIKAVLEEAYDDARTSGIGDDGGCEAVYGYRAVEIILAALDDAGFEIVPKMGRDNVPSSQ